MTGRRRRWLVAGLLVAVLAGAYAVLWATGAVERLADGEGLKRSVLDMGAAGPLLIVGLMTLAVVMSPLPSAPIALASGAAFGHFWGTAYVVIGSFTGALIAFTIGRMLGYEAVRSWLGRRATDGILSRFVASQAAMMATVFVARLLPFVSFDAVSYIAGVTPLAAWRFALATFLGIIPTSFALAHFGDVMVSEDWETAALIVLALGGLTLTPVAWKALPRRRRTAIRRALGLDAPSGEGPER